MQWLEQFRAKNLRYPDTIDGYIRGYNKGFEDAKKLAVESVLEDLAVPSHGKDHISPYAAAYNMTIEKTAERIAAIYRNVDDGLYGPEYQGQ